MRYLRLILLALYLPGWIFASDTATVLRVIDGDTLVVKVDGREEKVRLIGVDTPETVHPNKPVEYFGKEASAFTKRMAEGKEVRLEADPENDDRDRYGRLLRYVWLPDGRLLNLLIVQEGYGHAYTKYPFSRMEEFRKAEREARELGRGLWGAEFAEPSSTNQMEEAVGSSTVYVTNTGSKYHEKGCRYLARSQIPIALESAARAYQPCSVCTPPTLESKEAASTPEPSNDITVYRTKTGSKYHRSGCRYLSKSSYPIKLSDAVKRYGPCSVCRPPKRK